MVIVKIMGGFGNQLSQFACGYSVAKYLKQELILDVSDYENGYFRPFCLDYLNIGQYRKVYYPFPSAKTGTVECVAPEFKTNEYAFLEQDKGIDSRERLWEQIGLKKHCYLFGYWGSKYLLPDDKKDLINMFCLKSFNTALEIFKEKIQSQYSIGVHIRRTDFVELKWADTENYYKAAISYVLLFHPDAHFYFFSDDIWFVRNTFGLYENFHYVHIPGGMEADLEEFFCLSSCNGRILSSSSSYSFWAGYLHPGRRNMDICYEKNASGAHEEALIYLNDSAVEALGKMFPSLECHKETEPIMSVGKAQFDEWYNLLETEKNEEVIRGILKAAMDCGTLSEEEFTELTTVGAIAYAQAEQPGLAVQSFYRLLQYNQDHPVFHMNFAFALYQAGLQWESAVHAGLANKFSDLEEKEECESWFDEEAAKEVYHLVQDIPKRHYIFAPMIGWSYYPSYILSMAILLARMGHKVSVISNTDNDYSGFSTVHDAVDYMVNHFVRADRVYNYHINIYYCGYLMLNGNKEFCLTELINQLSALSDEKAVVIASHPLVYQRPHSKQIPYIVPDIYDLWNRERHLVDYKEYIRFVGRYADYVLTSDPRMDGKKLGKEHNAKLLKAGVDILQDKKPCFINGFLDFTANYYESDILFTHINNILKIDL